MRNIGYSFAIGTAVFAALHFPGLLGLGEAIVPAVLAMILAYFLLARRTFKKVEAIFNEAMGCIQSMPPKIDLAIKKLEGAHAYGPIQIGVKSQVDAQIGCLLFLQQEFNKATPYLERSLGFGHWLAAGMLAVIHYKKKDHAAMKRVIEIATKRGKGQSLAWNLRAYLLCQIGERDAAQAVLAEALKKTKNDERIKESILALQNGKKIKMKVYKEQWYQFHLERPPMEMQQQVIPMRMSKAARRGRW